MKEDVLDESLKDGYQVKQVDTIESVEPMTRPSPDNPLNWPLWTKVRGPAIMSIVVIDPFRS